MAEAIEVPYAVESGKNVDELIKYYQTYPSANFSGTGKALGPVVAQLGYVPGYGKEPDVPGNLDDIAKAGESNLNTILLRRNRIGNLVPKRFDEFLEDRQDAAFGSLWDYFIGPGLKIIGFYKAGVNSNEDDADKFIKELNKRHPINSHWEMESALARYGYHGPEIEGFKSTKKDHGPSETEKRSVYLQLKLLESQYKKTIAEGGLARAKQMYENKRRMLINEEIKGMKDDSRRFKDFLKSSVA